MLSKKLKPIFIKKENLIRVGPKIDGGYVINKRNKEIILIFNKFYV